jgi:hypothetical protein
LQRRPLHGDHGTKRVPNDNHTFGGRQQLLQRLQSGGVRVSVEWWRKKDERARSVQLQSDTTGGQ